LRPFIRSFLSALPAGDRHRAPTAFAADQLGSTTELVVHLCVPGKWRNAMLKDEDVAVLCDIQQSIAFADDKHGQVEKLIVEGYVVKDGDIYELTPKGEKVVADRGAGLNEA
jgi:hypothetical protein